MNKWIVLFVILTASMTQAACSRAVTSPAPAGTTIVPTNPFPTTVVPQSTATPTTQTPQTPQMVWLPQMEGAAGDPSQVWVLRSSGRLSLEASPVPIQVFWDYSEPIHSLAYSPNFWHASQVGSMSVTDLHVYDYATGEDVLWLADDVVRAAWQPLKTNEIRPLLAVVVFNNESARFDLVLMSAPGQMRRVAENVSPRFAWSPDGSQVAFIRPDDWRNPQTDGDVVLFSTTGGGERVLGRFADAASGPIGDRPAWLDGSALLTAGYRYETGLPLSVYPLNGAASYQLGGGTSDPSQLLPPLSILWSPNYNQLIIGHDGGQTAQPSVWVYSLSDDLRTVVESYWVTKTNPSNQMFLVGWLTPSESLIVLEEGKPLYWSLKDRAWIRD